MKTTPLRVERRAYDGELVAYWDAELLRRRSKMMIWHAAPLTSIIYPRRGFSTPLRRHELGWVWLDRRYTVSVELSEAGSLERAICRICQPPVFNGAVVSIVELGLRLIVTPGPEVLLEDDEFQEAANDYGYDPQLRAQAWSAVEEARGLLTGGSGPFGPDLEKMYGLALKHTRVPSY
jgi:protein associated with RNAse G/E